MRAGNKLTVLALILIAVVAGLLLLRPERGKDKPSPLENRNRAERSKYGKYDCQADGAVVVLGIQPLWMPASALTESMRRDRLLYDGLKSEGLEPCFFPFFNGSDLNRFLAAGKLQGGFAGDIPAISAAARQDIKVVTLLHQGFVTILANRRLPLSELKGASIGYTPGSSAHWALFNTLALAGLDHHQIRPMPMDITEMPAAFESGRVTVLTSWEPNTTVFLQKYPQLKPIHRSRYSGFLYFTKSLFDQRPRTARLIIAAQFRALSWLKADQANLYRACEWARQAQQHLTGLTPELSVEGFAALVRSDLLDVAPMPVLGQSTFKPQGEMFKKYEFLLQHGLVPENCGWDRISGSVDRGAALEVISYPNQYRLDEYDYSYEVN